MVAVPVAWAVLLLFHPTGDGDEFYPVVRDQVTAWLVVHVGTLLFVPLLAGVVYLLLRGVEGVAARLSRIALAVFALFYTAWEVLIGLGTGILVDQVNRLPAAERATGAQLVEDFTGSSLIRAFELIGGFAWLIAVVAAGVALFRRSDAPSSVAVVLLLVVSAVPITWHVPPFGPVGLALFITAMLLVLRGRSSTRASAPADSLARAARCDDRRGRGEHRPLNPRESPPPPSPRASALDESERRGRRCPACFRVAVEELHQEPPSLREGAMAGSKAVERAREEHGLKGGPERRLGSLCLWVEDHEVAEAVVVYVERPHPVRGPHVRQEGLDVTQLLGARSRPSMSPNGRSRPAVISSKGRG